MKVFDGMVKEVVSLPETLSIIEAKRILEEKGIRRLPIVNEDKKLLGYVTHNMLFRATILNAPLSSIMEREVMTCSPEDALTSIIPVMLEEKIDGMPVLQYKKLVGIITRRDILKLFQQYMTLHRTKNEPWIVNSWMSYSPISFSEEQLIHEALEKMAERDIRRILVLDKSGKLVGLVTKNRILRASNLKTSIASIMTTNLLILQPKDSLEKACQFMVEKKISGVPILDGQKLAGVLTDTDLLRCFYEILAGEDVPKEVANSMSLEILRVQYEKEMEQLTKHLAWISKRLAVMERAVHLFTHLENLEENLTTALNLVSELVPCEAGSILLVDKEQKQFFFSVAFGKNSEKLENFFIPLEKGIAGACFKEKQTIIVSDVTADPRYYKEVGAAVGFEAHSLVAVPLVSDGICLGVMELLNKKNSSAFVASEIQVLEKMARLIGNLIDLSLKIT
ncbi:MAG: CBS domain-containing protein [Planctomycetota bacterium]